MVSWSAIRFALPPRTNADRHLLAASHARLTKKCVAERADTSKNTETATTRDKRFARSHNRRAEPCRDQRRSPVAAP
jgi:hypothetical protein